LRKFLFSKRTFFFTILAFSSITLASPSEEAKVIINSPIYKSATEFGVYLEKNDFQIISQLKPVEDVLNISDKSSIKNNIEIQSKLFTHIKNLTEWHDYVGSNGLSDFQKAILELRLGYLHQYDGDPKKEKSYSYLIKSGEYFVNNIPFGNSFHAVGLDALFNAYLWRGPLKSMQDVANKIIEPQNIKAISEGLTSQDKHPLCSANFQALSQYHIAYNLDGRLYGISKKLVELANKCQSKDMQILTLRNFASDAFIEGRYSESIKAYNILLKKYNDEASQETVGLKFELAQVYKSKNDKKSSAITLKSALIDCKKIPECFRNFEIQFNLNELNNRNDLNKQLVLREISKSDLDYFRFDLFQKLSGISESEGNLAEAIFYQKIALSHAQNAYQKMIAGLRDNQIKFEDVVVELFESGYRRLEKMLIDDDRLPEADEVMGYLKSSELADFTRGEEFLIPNILDKSYLTEQEMLWLNIYQSLSNNSKITDLSKKIGKTSKVKINFRNTISSQNNLAIIQKKLSDLESTILIRYYVTPKSLDVILTTPNSQSVFRIDITKEELKSKINDFRFLLKKPTSDPIPKAIELYRILFNAKLEDEIKKNNPKTILLALDSNLRYLPFSALHDGEKYLIESVATSIYMENKKDSITKQRNKEGKIFGFGISKSIAGFPKLPSVEIEMRALEDNRVDAKIFMDNEFTNTALVSASRQYPSLVHISSHFVFSPGTESNSYLLMGDGKKLSLSEMRSERINFQDLDLMTLSACSTALGGGLDENGREIDGFADLMLKHGVNSVIATLWAVSDFGSGELMKIFYQAERDTASKNASLRKAQLSLLKGKNLNHPYYWAPFILIGDY